MNRVIRHIEFLLMQHDCVIVPGVGAVLAHRMSAGFDESGERMLSPVRAFTFNPSLCHNDGMLAASIARAEGLSYEAAARILEAEVAEMRLRLDNDSRMVLGRVGTLLRNADGSMRFIVGTLHKHSPSTMWLPEVNLEAFAKAENTDCTVAVKRMNVRPRRILSKITKMAAAVTVLFAVGVALTTPIKVDNAQYASLGVESISLRKSAPALIESPGEAKAPVVLVLERHDDAATRVDTAAYSALRNAARVKTPAAASGRYCLVVASLASEKEARQFMENSKDTSLGILVKDGRFRVYAAEGATIADVQAAASASGADRRFPDSWVCRR